MIADAAVARRSHWERGTMATILSYWSLGRNLPRADTLEAGLAVHAVAERLVVGMSAAAKGDRGSRRGHGLTRGIEHFDIPLNDQGSVLQCLDFNVCHDSSLETTA